MSETRQLVRVFLASPGDLVDERRAANSVVDEFNSLWADEFGCQVELVGWEDTVPGYGRPQAVINRELEHCELFVGLMWKRWGTPPDTGGPYSSGFEEEFTTSLERRKREGRPEISLFFKDIPPEFLRDPGEDLKKVLAFRDGLEAKKVVLFDKFADSRQLEGKLRRCISAYIRRRKTEERGGAPNQAQAPTVSDMKRSGKQSSLVDENPLSNQGAAFLGEIVAKLGAPGGAANVAAAEVARFRLLASAVGSQGNDEPSLGVHDANLLFRHRDALGLGGAEMTALLARGLEHFPTENVPLWRWLAAQNGFKRLVLPVWSVMEASAALRIGALRAMRLLHQQLLPDEKMERRWFTDAWLEKETPASVKTAALGYLAECGLTADLPAVRGEFDRGDSQTAGPAAEALLRITLRDSRQRAVLALYDIQSTSISAGAVRATIGDGAGVDNETLLSGIENRNSDVRAAAVALLRGRRALPPDLAEKLLADDDASVRYEALCSLRDGGRQYTLDQAKGVLVKQQQRAAFMLKSTSGTDQWSAFEHDLLSVLPDGELEKMAADGPLTAREPYFVLAERRFRSYAPVLRKAVDDRYASEFDRFIRRMASVLGEGHDLVGKWRPLEEFTRQQATREALDILCRKASPEDLPRVRATLKSGFVEFSAEDVKFLQKVGEWADIPLIAEAAMRPTAGLVSSLLSVVQDDKFEISARAMYALGRSRVPELIALPMPHQVLVQLLRCIPAPVFQRLEDASIEELLRSEHDSVRKVAAAKSVVALGRARVSRMLERYISGDQPYFYNVVHWLDLGASAPNRIASESANRVLEGTP